MELEPFVFSHTGALVGTRDIHRDNSDDETLAAINRLALRPLQLEEVAVFTLDLCNNQVDRHFSRFPEEELERINQLTPGRPLMERHDLRGTLPRGTFFRSHLHRNGDHISVRPEVYVLRAADNHDFILNIEGGVYRETSIGFSFRTPECAVCGQDLRTCAHVPGKSYSGKTCHFIMRDVLEVIEGSVVSAGSQGTRFVAQHRAVTNVKVGTGTAAFVPHSSCASPHFCTTPEAALAQAREHYHQPIELTGNFWAKE